MNTLRLMWNGFWLGVGAELSFFVLWALWHFAYKRLAHRFDPEHLLHKLHDYFTT